MTDEIRTMRNANHELLFWNLRTSDPGDQTRVQSARRGTPGSPRVVRRVFAATP